MTRSRKQFFMRNTIRRVVTQGLQLNFGKSWKSDPAHQNYSTSILLIAGRRARVHLIGLKVDSRFYTKGKVI